MSSWDVKKGNYVTFWNFGCSVTKSLNTKYKIYIYIYRESDLERLEGSSKSPKTSVPISLEGDGSSTLKDGSQ